jgi:hypothetical protein
MASASPWSEPNNELNRRSLDRRFLVDKSSICDKMKSLKFGGIFYETFDCNDPLPGNSLLGGV